MSLENDMKFKPPLIIFYTIQLYPGYFTVNYELALFSYLKRKIEKGFRNKQYIYISHLNHLKIARPSYF